MNVSIIKLLQHPLILLQCARPQLVLRVFMAMMEGQHTHDFSKRFYHDESNVITRDLRRKSGP